MKNIILSNLFALLLVLSPALAVAKSKNKILQSNTLSPHTWLIANQSQPNAFQQFMFGTKPQQQTKPVIKKMAAPKQPKLQKAPKAPKVQKAPKAPKVQKAPKQNRPAKVKTTKVRNAGKAPAPQAAKSQQPNFFSFAKPAPNIPAAPKSRPVPMMATAPIPAAITKDDKVLKIDPKSVGKTEITSRYAKVNASTSFAAVFIYAENNGQPYFLMTKKYIEKMWHPLMGKSTSTDTFYTDTAERVAADLTKGYIPLTAEELLGSPSHDYITSEGTLRTYFVAQPFVPADDINAFIKTKKFFGQEFAWIPVDAFFNSVMKGPYISEGSLGWTIEVTAATPTVTGGVSQRIAPINPRAFGALRTEGGLDLLSKLASGQTLPIRATQSYHMASKTKPDVIAALPQLALNIKNWPTVDTSAVKDKSKTKLDDEESEQLAQAITKKGDLLSEIKAKALKIKKNLKKVEPKDPLLKQDIAAYQGNMGQDKVADEQKLTADQKALGAEFEKYTYSQTDAQLRVTLKDRFLQTYNDDDDVVRRANAQANIYEFLLTHSRLARKGKFDYDFSDSYFKTLTDAYVKELKNKDMVAFYHSTPSGMAFIYDLYTEFRNQLTLAVKDKSNPALRGLDDDFMRFMDVNDFYAFFEQGKGKFNYRKVQNLAYPSLGLSTNYSLFGSDGRKNSETYTFFHDGFSRRPADNAWLFNQFTEQLGLKTSFDRYSPLINRYLENEQRNITLNPLLDNPSVRKSDLANNGRLLQIFVHPSVVDQIAHTAYPGGEKLVFPNLPTVQGDYSGTRFVIEAMRKAPFDFFKNQLPSAHIIHEPVNPKELISAKDFQARLLLKPEIMFNPNLVKIETYWRHPIANEAEYRDTLRALVREDLKKWLLSRIKAKGKVFGANDAAGGQGLALQKLYEQIVEGQKVKVSSIVAKPSAANTQPVANKPDPSTWTLSKDKKSSKKDDGYWYFD